MFYLLSKLLYFFINPLTWILVLLGIAFFSKKAKRKKWTLGVALFLLLFFTNGYLFLTIGKAWEIPPVPMDQLKENYEVAIVLGGFSKPGIEPDDRFHLRSAATRLTTAIELYKKGKVKKILLTGGEVGITHKLPSESLKAQEFLILLGIDSSDILVENQARNTYENATNSVAILEEHNIKKALLITSAYHMRRSVACFDKQGFQTVPFSVDLFETKVNQEIFALILPSISIFKEWEAIIREWFGLLAYKMNGYI